MRFTEMIFLVAIIAYGACHQEEPTLAPPSDERFSVKAIKERMLFRATAIERIEANGNTYLAFETDPEQVAAVVIETEGNTTPWISVQKAGSTKLPIVLEEFEKGRFLFEHDGPGTYHVNSQEAGKRPAWDEFVIEGEVAEPPVDDPPPPVTDHSKLSEIVADMMPSGEPNVAKALADAYRKAIRESADEGVTLEQARIEARDARRVALNALPPLRGNWNAMLLPAGQYLSSLATKADYLKALEFLASELEKASQANSQSIRSPTNADQFVDLNEMVGNQVGLPPPVEVWQPVYVPQYCPAPV